ncbi:MAG: ATP-binding protein [Oligoflexales bacterium]
MNNLSSIAVRKLPSSHLSVEELIENFKSLFEYSHDAMNLFSLSTGKVLVQNAAAYRLTGYTEIDYENIPIENFYPPEELPKVAANFQKQVQVGFVEEQVKMYCKGRQLKDLWIRSYVVQTTPEIICITHTIDLTAEVAKQRRKIEEAKMAVLGLSAAGIAHELGNALQSFEYNIYKLEERCMATSQSTEDLLHIENLKNLSQFMGQILKSVSLYSSGKTQSCEGVSVNAVVDAALQLLQGFMKHNRITVRTEYASNIPPIKIDPNHLQQIVVNIAKNAVQAMAKSEVRILTVATAIKNGGVEVSIDDTGAGIPAHLVDKVFNLFETTKEFEEGHGIGLALAKQLAEQNNIALGVNSEENRGSEFVLSIPCMAHDASKPCIVLIGDHYGSLQQKVRSMHDEGYSPFVATKVSHALKVLELHPVDWIICEQEMYPLSGTEFVKRFVNPNSYSVVILGDQEFQERPLGGHESLAMLPSNPAPEVWKKLFSPTKPSEGRRRTTYTTFEEEADI